MSERAPGHYAAPVVVLAGLPPDLAPLLRQALLEAGYRSQGELPAPPLLAVVVASRAGLALLDLPQTGVALILLDAGGDPPPIPPSRRWR